MKLVANRSARRALALGLIGAASVVAGAVNWTELGPAPIANGSYTGRVSAIACSPTNQDLYFVAGADGGVWRTTDGGTTWTPLTDQMPTSAMGALAIDPTNESVIYAGSGEGNYANHSRYGLGLYKSIDGGNTWTVLAADVFSGRCFSKVLINPLNPQRLYASITRAGGFPEMAAAKGHPGATGPVGVFRSDDGGVTWTQLLNGLPNLSATDLATDPTAPNVLYAGIGHIFGSPDNGIYKSIDGGDGWTKLAGGLPTANVGRISVAVAPSLTTRVYTLISHNADATGGGAGVLGGYRSNDAGTTWSQMTALPSIQATYGWYLSLVGVHPTTPDTVFMGGVDMVRTTNGGTNWSTVTPPHVDMHPIAWDAAGRLVVGDDGGVHVSSNLGTNWIAKNSGLGVIQCYAGLSTHPTQDYTMFVGLQDNGTIRRLSSGSWTQVFGGDGGWTQVNQSNPLVVFCEYQGTGNLYRSTNGGSAFNFSGTGIDTADDNCFLPPYLIDPALSTRMIYGTQRIWRSLNTGASWTAFSGDLTNGGIASIRSLAYAPSNSSYVYAATNDGRVLVSTDGGQNFTLVLENVPSWPRVMRQVFVHPTECQTVYLAAGAFGTTQIQRSVNGGQTWEALDANFPDIPVNTVAVDVRGNKPVIYAGADDGLYRSLNNGASWHRYGSGLPRTAVIDLRLEIARSRLIACTQGRGLWMIAVGLPGDLNGDGSVNAFDIDPFVLALTDPAAYAAQYPTLDRILLGDVNGDGALDAFDIDPFVEVLLP